MSLTKVTYSMIADNVVNAKDFGAVGNNVADDTAALQAALNAAQGNTLFIPAGSYKVTSALTVPKNIKIVGSTMRGQGPTTAGTSLNAFFAGPVLSITSVSPAFSDTLIQNINVIGNRPVYGAGNGIEITNRFNTMMERMTVAGFGTNQINIGAGSYGCILRDIYAAETYAVGTSNANYYLASEYCTLDSCTSDAGKYSVYLALGAYGTDVINGTFEGSTVAVAYVVSQATVDRNLFQGNKFNCNVSGIGVYSDANRTHIVNNYMVGAGGAPTEGIKLDENSYGAVVVGNSVVGFQTGLYLKNAGQNTIGNNVVNGSAVGVDVQGGAGYPTYQQIFSNNHIGGAISLRHNQNSKTSYLNNTLTDGAGVYVAPTIVSGTPLIIGPNATDQFYVSSGAARYPANTLIVEGGGGTNIVSVGAADSGGTGYRLLRIPN